MTLRSVTTNAMPESRADDEERHDPRRRIAGFLPLDHPERHAGQERGAEDEAEDIDPTSLAVRRLGDGNRGQDERHGTEAQVEPENGPPAREADEEAADDRTKGQGEAGHRGPHAKGIGAGLPLRVDVPDDGQGAGLAGRGADTHDHAAGDEPINVPRQCGHDGATTEDGHAREHHALTAEDVAEHPGGEHEAGERQRVAVDDPLQRGDAGVQIALDVGETDADDRVVQERQEEDPAQRCQRQRLGGRAEPTLFDVEARRRAFGDLGALGSLRQHRAPPRDGPVPVHRGTRFMDTSFAYPCYG